MTDVAFEPAIPVLRIYDIAKAKEFYVDFLGFAIDWEHRYGPDFPLYMQVSRGGLKLHLSEHYGDGTPGSVVYIAAAILRPSRRNSTTSRPVLRALIRPIRPRRSPTRSAMCCASTTQPTCTEPVASAIAATRELTRSASS